MAGNASQPSQRVTAVASKLLALATDSSTTTSRPTATTTTSPNKKGLNIIIQPPTHQSRTQIDIFSPQTPETKKKEPSLNEHPSQEEEDENKREKRSEQSSAWIQLYSQQEPPQQPQQSYNARLGVSRQDSSEMDIASPIMQQQQHPLRQYQPQLSIINDDQDVEMIIA